VRTRWNEKNKCCKNHLFFYFILFCVKCPDITTRFHWNCWLTVHTSDGFYFHTYGKSISTALCSEFPPPKWELSITLWSFNRTVSVFFSISPRSAWFRNRYVESREKVQVPCYSCVQIIGAHNKPSADAVSGGSLLRHINPRGSTRREYETTAMRDGAGHRQANISSQFKNPSRNHFRTPWRPRGYRSSAA